MAAPWSSPAICFSAGIIGTLSRVSYNVGYGTPISQGRKTTYRKYRRPTYGPYAKRVSTYTTKMPNRRPSGREYPVRLTQTLRLLSQTKPVLSVDQVREALRTTYACSAGYITWLLHDAAVASALRLFEAGKGMYEASQIIAARFSMTEENAYRPVKKARRIMARQFEISQRTRNPEDRLRAWLGTMFLGVIKDKESRPADRRAAIRDLAKMLGINKPQKVAWTTPDGESAAPLTLRDVILIGETERVNVIGDAQIIDVVDRAQERLLSRGALAAESTDGGDDDDVDEGESDATDFDEELPDDEPS